MEVKGSISLTARENLGLLSSHGTQDSPSLEKIEVFFTLISYTSHKLSTTNKSYFDVQWRPVTVELLRRGGARESNNEAEIDNKFHCLAEEHRMQVSEKTG